MCSKEKENMYKKQLISSRKTKHMKLLGSTRDTTLTASNLQCILQFSFNGHDRPEVTQ